MTKIQQDLETILKELQEIKLQLLELNVNSANMGTEVQEGVTASNEHLTMMIDQIKPVVDEVFNYITLTKEYYSKYSPLIKEYSDLALNQYHKTKRLGKISLIFIIVCIFGIIWKNLITTNSLN